MNNENVTGVTYYDKSGQNIVTAKVVIDCSGDGDIAAKAGVPFEKGDEAQGQMMAVSLTFFTANVEVDKIDEYDDPYFEKYAQKGISSGRLHQDLHNIYWFPGFHKNTIFYNAVHIKDVDGTNPFDLAKATIEARKRVRQLAAFFKEEIPGFEKSRDDLFTEPIPPQESGVMIFLLCLDLLYVLLT